MVGFGEAVRSGFQQFAVLRGRATRAEYWWWTLFTSLVTNGLTFAFGETSLILAAASIALLIPSFAVTVRRLHDTDRSAWSLLVLLLPFVGVLVLLFFLLRPSDPASNRFGAPRVVGAGGGWSGPSTAPGGADGRWDDVPPPPPAPPSA